MKKIINLYKKIGETPLEALNKFKSKNISYKDIKMGYAGRLDPMAEGVLIALVGDENKKMKKYMNLSKEYKAEILFGFSSDSNDVLGIPEKGNNLKKEDEELLKKTIKEFKGKYNQKIPKYSSYRIKGKPMFHYALKNIEIEEIRKDVIIKSLKIKSTYAISSKRLLKYILNKIKKVKGNFRQEKIAKKWEKLLKDDKKYYVADISIACSSGTYIRAIADDLGNKMDSKGLLLSLKRTRVGKFNINNSLKLK